MSGTESCQPRLVLPADVHVRCGGDVYRYRGRARDAAQKHVFVTDNGLPMALGDGEFVRLSQSNGANGEPGIRILSSAELAALKSEKTVNWQSLYDRASDAERLRVDNLIKFVRGWEDAGRPAKTESSLREVISKIASSGAAHAVSPSTLRRALNRWDGTPDSLVRQHHLKGNCEPRADEQAWLLHQELALAAYLSPERFDGPAVHAAVLRGFEKHNEGLPPGAEPLKALSLTTTYKMLAAEGSFMSDFTRRDSKRATRDHRAIGKALAAEFVNETWEVDASPVPIILLDDASKMPIGRATITLVLDRYSRAIMGFDLSWRAESLRSVAAALSMAIAPKDALLKEAGLTGKYPMMGKPTRLVADHASHTGLRAKQFKSMCKRLGCEPSNTRVAFPSDKGKVERMLRTYFFKVCHVFPGSTFSDIFERNKEEVEPRR